jgi:hypothetical protein
MDHISTMESEFTVEPRPRERVFGDSIRANVSKVIQVYREAVGPESIRVYNKPFFWKGSIVDGKKALFTIFDVPRHDTPLRYTENRQVVKHFEKFYFDEIWQNARPIKQILGDKKGKAQEQSSTHR